MGVHGLTTLLRTSGLLVSSSPPPAPSARAAEGHRRPVGGAAGEQSHDDGEDGSAGLGPGPGTPPPPPSSPAAILAVDGSGLAFRLIRNAHVRHCAEVIASSSSSSTSAGAAAPRSPHGPANNAGAQNATAAAARHGTATTLLPTMLPLRSIDREADYLLSRLFPDLSASDDDGGGGGGIERVDLYFDGPDQPLKAAELRRRRLRREEEWENLRRYCAIGALPPGCDDAATAATGTGGSGGAKKKKRRRRGGRRASAAARTAAAAADATSDGRSQEGGGGSNAPNVAAAPSAAGKATSLSEAYLSAFPLSRLSLVQARSSLERWTRRLGPSRLRIIECAGEADADVARASADDPTCRTLAVGQDSDFLIYGRRHDDDDVDDADAERIGGGEVRYLPFDALEWPRRCLGGDGDGSRNAVADADLLRYAALARSDVALTLGLPDADAMVELSIALGNDYTGPYVRHDDRKKRKAYRDSLRWEEAPSTRGGDGLDDQDDCAGGETDDDHGDDDWSQVDWSDIHSVVDHVASECASGRRLISTAPELQSAVDYSRALYGLRDDAADFVPADFVAHAGNADENDEDDGNGLYAGINAAAPSLPRDMVLSPIDDGAAAADVRVAALRPAERYVAEASSTAAAAMFEEKHLDAFRTVLDEMESLETGESAFAPPTAAASKLDWNDVRAAYVVERCVAAALRSGGGNIGAGASRLEPHHLFDMAAYHAALDALSYEDFPLDNEVVGQGEKSFLEEFIENSASAAEIAKDEEDEEEDDGATAEDAAAAGGGAGHSLPIDDHQEEILEAVRTRRVSIIHGETGCGKSSRVPVMLLRAPVPEWSAAAREVKMFISQPRRIAVKSLAERVRSTEPDLRSKIALRMGHGVREYESSSTRAIFATTGYIVRLLANHPETFASHTHLIIDEVHERSVDTDVLCLLCRRLLEVHPTLRLILMSATMAAELYAQYFGSPEPPIHVGARRHAIREYFVEDLADALHLGPKDLRACRDVHKECENRKCRAAPSNSHMDKLYRLATQITLSVGSHGSSVLIFVPGMADISAITERIEELNVPGVVHTCLPIHSDIPFEEQMAAFDPPGPGEVKVVLATNAAESSVTLPDVDHVVCLGLCKQIVYNPSSHRQMLQACWISRASATQRAGRTGRVREGNVYRLYSRDAYERYMDPFEAGEMVRIPLDSVILSLREMLGEAVTPVLLGCLEPPDVSNIERSFQSLHESRFISEPSDEGCITSLGSLVVSLGIDLTLGSLVGLGIQFGVAPEAIQMAAILSFPKSPWLMTNPLYHEAAQFNDITAKTFVSRCQFDGGLYSEPLAIMNLLYDYSHSTSKERFCRQFSVSSPRLRQLSNTVDSLRRRVAAKLNVALDSLDLEQPPKRMCHAKLTVLRTLKLWAFSDAVITSAPSKAKKKAPRSGAPYAIALDGPEITEAHLGQVLSRERHPCALLGWKKIVHTGRFAPVGDDAECDWNGFRERFVSFVAERGYSAAWYCLGSSVHVFVSSGAWDQSEPLRRAVSGLFGGSNCDTVVISRSDSNNRRGRKGRACGAWCEVGTKAPSGEGTMKLLSFSATPKKKRLKEMKKVLDAAATDAPEVVKHLSCTVALPPNPKKNAQSSFVLVAAGQCEEVPRVDMHDLFSTPEVSYSIGVNPSPQVIAFDEIDHNRDKKAGGTENNGPGRTTTIRPLLEDIPEGARLLSVLASERRRDHFIRFSDAPTRAGGARDDADSDAEEACIDVDLPAKETKISRRWRRAGAAGGAVYVAENCVPAAAVSTAGSTELFACCANTLEVKGGGVRVEGLTLLPPGRLFAAVALLSFGCLPFDLPEVFFDEEKKAEDEGYHVAQDVVAWVQQGRNMCVDKERGPGAGANEILSRIYLAMEFNAMCYDLGEELVCHPEKVVALCSVFDQIEGDIAVEPWDSLHSGPFTPGSFTKRRNKQGGHSTAGGQRVQSRGLADADVESCAAELTKLSLSAAKANTKPTKRKYSCLSCAQIWNKWSKCEAHMRKCCPEVISSSGQVDLMEKCAAKANTANSPAANPDYVPERRVAELAAVGTSSKGKSKVKAKNRKYSCLRCAQTWSKWSKCEGHMRECCPELMSTQGKVELMETCAGVTRNGEGSGKAKAVRRYRCVSCAQLWNKLSKYKGHIAECCPAGQDDIMAKCVIIVVDREDGTEVENRRYRCLCCDQMWSKWKKCEGHMKECCPEHLREKRI